MWLAQRDLISGPPVSRLNLAEGFRRRMTSACLSSFGTMFAKDLIFECKTYSTRVSGE
jgi:hypothetical protein